MVWFNLALDIGDKIIILQLFINVLIKMLVFKLILVNVNMDMAEIYVIHALRIMVIIIIEIW